VLAAVDLGLSTTDLPHRVPVRQDLEGLFERLEILRAQDHSGGAAVARQEHPFMALLDTVDDLGKTLFDLGEGKDNLPT